MDRPTIFDGLTPKEKQDALKAWRLYSSKVVAARCPDDRMDAYEEYHWKLYALGMFTSHHDILKNGKYISRSGISKRDVITQE